MSSQKRIFELTAEIQELEKLLAKAEQNAGVEGRWGRLLAEKLAGAAKASPKKGSII